MKTRVIKLNKTGYDPFIDYLKGVAILFVVLDHALPHHGEMAFCLWVKQAVPLFLLIQVFHAYKHGVSNLAVTEKLPKLWQRIVKPFVLSQGCAFIVLLIAYMVKGEDMLMFVKDTLKGGGIGPGSYYMWIYIQFFFLLPLVAKLLGNRNIKDKMFVVMLSASILLEIICTYTHIYSWLYRLLCLRYVFLIYLGYEWVHSGIVLNVKTLALSTLSIVFLLIFQYTDWNMEPFFYHHGGWKKCHWIVYFYVATLFVFILKWVYNRLPQRVNDLLRQMGRFSYEIYLLQMLVFKFVSLKPWLAVFMPIIGVKPLVLILYWVTEITLSIVPVLIYKKVTCCKPIGESR